MTVCVSVSWNPVSVYPVLDPHRTAGPGPYRYGYGFAWDLVEIDVTRDTSLSACQMRINLVSQLSWFKEVKGWNYFNQGFNFDIGTTPGLKTSALITKPQPTAGCFTGTDTVVLCKQMGAFMTGLYCFNTIDFWDFWGGFDVTFIWVADDGGSDIWGEDTSEPIYPLVRQPDGTLMQVPTGSGATQLAVAAGGAQFVINDPNDIPALGLDPNSVIQADPLPLLPVDYTSVRELNSGQTYVVVGGAKFLIDPHSIFALSWLRHANRVRVIPPGGTNQLNSIPYDGTLIKEQHNPKVYVVKNQQLCWVLDQTIMDANCFSWRNVRTVPDGTLAQLPRGNNIS